MADKRQIKREIKRLQRIKTWQLLILLVIAGFLAVPFLRLNNIGMVQRREAVLAADRDGNDADVATRLYDLQRYVAAHMNADTGQFDLQGQYQRDKQKAIDEAANATAGSNNIHNQAEATCRARYPDYRAGSQLAYQQCFLDEIDKYPPASRTETNVVLPSAGLYRHSFASPLWSPDFAGFSVLAFLLIAFLIIVRMIALVVLHLVLKFRYRGFAS